MTARRVFRPGSSLGSGKSNLRNHDGAVSDFMLSDFGFAPLRRLVFPLRLSASPRISARTFRKRLRILFNVSASGEIVAGNLCHRTWILKS